LAIKKGQHGFLDNAGAAARETGGSLGLRRQSAAATALSNLPKINESKIASSTPKSGVALRLPPQSMTRMGSPGVFRFRPKLFTRQSRARRANSALLFES
jgi:hypothetical protein